MIDPPHTPEGEAHAHAMFAHPKIGIAISWR